MKKETDKEFVERMKSTKGIPSEAEAERLRRLQRDHDLDKIVRRK